MRADKIWIDIDIDLLSLRGQNIINTFKDISGLNLETNFCKSSDSSNSRRWKHLFKV